MNISGKISTGGCWIAGYADALDVVVDRTGD